MAWTSPTTRTTGTLITASIYNTDIVDNLIYLYSQVNAQFQMFGFKLITTSGAGAGSLETTTNKINVDTTTFIDGATTYYAQRWFVLPADYDGGTVTVQFYWLCQDASTNSVVWQVRAGAWADSDALDTALGTAQTVTDANNANTDVNISAATSALTIAGSPAAGELVLFEVFRDPTNGSDNLAATAELLGIVVNYTRA